MMQIEQITTDTLQKQTLVLPDGNFIQITLYFVPLQAGWFIRDLTYQDFTAHNIRIVVVANMLYQFKNQIPFGLGCFTKQKREPTFQDDFSSEAFSLYVLSAAEVEEFSEILKNG